MTCKHVWVKRGTKAEWEPLPLEGEVIWDKRLVCAICYVVEPQGKDARIAYELISWGRRSRPISKQELKSFFKQEEQKANIEKLFSESSEDI